MDYLEIYRSWNFNSFNMRSCAIFGIIHVLTKAVDAICVTVTKWYWFFNVFPINYGGDKNVIKLTGSLYNMEYVLNFRLMRMTNPAILVGPPPVTNASYSSKLRRWRHTLFTLKLTWISHQQNPFLSVIFPQDSKVSYSIYKDNSTQYFQTELSNSLSFH